MNFLEALKFLQDNPEKSIVLERYSEEAKKRLQFYLHENSFVMQEGDNLPKLKDISAMDFNSSWVAYEGMYSKRVDELEEIDFLKHIEARLEDTLNLVRKYRANREQSKSKIIHQYQGKV